MYMSVSVAKFLFVSNSDDRSRMVRETFFNMVCHAFSWENVLLIGQASQIPYLFFFREILVVFGSPTYIIVQKLRIWFFLIFSGLLKGVLRTIRYKSLLMNWRSGRSGDKRCQSGGRHSRECKHQLVGRGAGKRKINETKDREEIFLNFYKTTNHLDLLRSSRVPFYCDVLPCSVFCPPSPLPVLSL